MLPRFCIFVVKMFWGTWKGKRTVPYIFLLDNAGFAGIAIAVFLVGGLIGVGITYWVIKSRQRKAQEDSKSILDEANRQADEVRRTARSEADAKVEAATQQSNLLLKSADSEAEKIKAQAQTAMANERIELHAKAEEEARLLKKDLEEEAEKLDAREDALDTRDSLLTQKEKKLDSDIQLFKKAQDDLEEDKGRLADEREELSALKTKEEEELSRIGGLSPEEAKDELMEKVKAKAETEIAEYLKDKHDEAEQKAEQNSRNILALAVERYAQDVAVEKTTTTYSLPSDELKGRIIGREGRNIKSLESLLGCDLVIDDTPGVVTISSFDPVRREIAAETLNRLIKDGRIQPGRIEEIYAKVRDSFESSLYEIGEDTCMSLGLSMISKQFYPYIGRLKYRTSFGQSVLDHSKQVSYLCGMMAAELGLDQTLAKRAGLLHDIGKSCDYEIDGSHVEIGVDMAKRFGEPDVVINSIAAHHGDCEKKYLIADLVVAADTLSAARPGARRETLENYLKRVRDLEDICKSYEGVSECYALQSGRDLRVMVVPEKVDDAACVVLAQKIKDRIENELTYPGYIKVTVIRETRTVETAK